MNPSKKTPNKIFFLGIGGSGMSGLAEVLFNLGYEVSGSDLIDSAVTRRLKSLGIDVRIGHETNNVISQDMIIKSCLLYTSDAADDLTRVDLGGRRIIKKNR